MADHPNRHIREALKYAAEQGWTIRKSSGRAHAWGVVYCHLVTGSVGCRFIRPLEIQKATRGIFDEP